MLLMARPEYDRDHVMTGIRRGTMIMLRSGSYEGRVQPGQDSLDQGKSEELFQVLRK